MLKRNKIIATAAQTPTTRQVYNWLLNANTWNQQSTFAMAVSRHGVCQQYTTGEVCPTRSSDWHITS